MQILNNFFFQFFFLQEEASKGYSECDEQEGMRTLADLIFIVDANTVDLLHANGKRPFDAHAHSLSRAHQLKTNRAMAADPEKVQARQDGAEKKRRKLEEFWDPARTLREIVNPEKCCKWDCMKVRNIFFIYFLLSSHIE